MKPGISFFPQSRAGCKHIYISAFAAKNNAVDAAKVCYGRNSTHGKIVRGCRCIHYGKLDDDIRASYKRVENIASHTLMNKLPPDMKKYYQPLLFGEEEALDFLDKLDEGGAIDIDTLNSDKKALEAYEWRLVKAADKLSALIKCIEEKNSGNHEFASALASTRAALDSMDIPAVDDFLNDFLPAYEMTLDELQGQ